MFIFITITIRKNLLGLAHFDDQKLGSLLGYMQVSQLNKLILRIILLIL